MLLLMKRKRVQNASMDLAARGMAEFQVGR